MRLIDADGTIPMIKYATTDNEIGIFPIKIGFDDIVKVLNAQPTVEAIPISWLEDFRDGLDTLSESQLMRAIDLIIEAYRLERKEE